MYLGEYTLQLDNKNRMRVPSRLRSAIEEQIYIFQGAKKCLFVMVATEFEKLVGKFSMIPLSDEKAQNSIRKIMSSAFIVEEDAQGRFVLPKSAKEYANIDKQIIFLGVNSRMEIWGKEEYESYKLDNPFSIDEALDNLKNYMI